MKKVKVLSLIAFSFVLLFGGVFYFVSQKINPQELKKIIETKLEESLKGTDVVLADLDYHIGTQATIDIKKLSINLKKPFLGQKTLFAVDQIYLNIPFGAILFGKGTIDLEIEKPMFVLAKDKEVSNWDQVVKKEDPKSETQKGKESESEEVELPSFLAKSKINLRFSDINLKIFEANKKSSFLIEKVLVKNFGLESKSAFEVASNLNYDIGKGEVLKSKILMIGQFDSEAFFSEGKIDSSIVLEVKDIVLPGNKTKAPNIHGEIKLNLVKDDLSLESKFNGDELFTAQVTASADKEKVSISKIDFLLNLARVSTYLKDKELLSLVDFNKAKVKVTGSASINKATSEINPKIAFETTDAIHYAHEGIVLKNSLKGNLNNTNLRGSIKTELLGGLILSSFNSTIDLNAASKNKDVLGTTFINVKGSNVKITKSQIQKMLYASGAKEEVKQAADADNSEKQEELTFPKLNLSLNLAPLFLDDESMEIKGKFFTRKNEFGSKKLHFNIGKGLGVLELGGKTSKKGIKSKIHFNMKKLNLASLNIFLPKIVQGIQGSFDGDIKGEITKSKMLSYNINYNFSATDGKLNNLNLASFITPYLNKISALKGKINEKDLKLTDQFQLLQSQGNLTDKLLELNQFNFKAKGKSADVKANGKVYLTPNGPSRVYGEITDKSGKVKKALGVTKLPVLLEGKGMGITPNFAYTTKKTGKKVIKKAAEKAVKKEVDKFLDKNKDKAKKLLKGLFR